MPGNVGEATRASTAADSAAWQGGAETSSTSVVQWECRGAVTTQFPIEWGAWLLDCPDNTQGQHQYGGMTQCYPWLSPPLVGAWHHLGAEASPAPTGKTLVMAQGPAQKH